MPLFMWGPPEAVIRDAYTYGPVGYIFGVFDRVQEGDVLVTKALDGIVISREQKVNGRFVPWSPNASQNG